MKKIYFTSAPFIAFLLYKQAPGLLTIDNFLYHRKLLIQIKNL